MASIMILSGNNSQRDLVMSHQGDTKHHCPLGLSYISTASFSLTQLNTKSGHFRINQKPRNTIKDKQDKVFLQRRDTGRQQTGCEFGVETPGQQQQQLRVNLKGLKESK